MTSSDSLTSNEDRQPSSSERDATVAPTSRFGFGLLLLLIGFGAVFFAGDIRELPIETADPGPRALPRALGWIMLAGGIWEGICGVLQLRNRSPLIPHSDSMKSRDASSTTPLVRIGIFLVVLVAYVAFIPRLGFHLSTAIFVSGMAASVRVKWWGILLTTALVLILIHLLFGVLFQVPLPRGEWFSG